MAYSDMEDMEIMKKFPLAVFVLALMCAVSSAFAGGPPMFIVSAPTGMYSYGYPLVHEAIHWLPIPGQGTIEYTVGFTQNWGLSYSESSSWTAIVDNATGALIAEEGTFSAPAVINGVFWSGINENRTQVPFEAKLLGPEWGPRKFTLWGPAGNVVGSTILHSQETYSATVTPAKVGLANANQAYYFRLETVPEPGSMTVMLSGLIGLGGVILRRRRA